jgi:xylulokinase
MGYVAVDLGTTNIKVAVYDDDLHKVTWLESPVHYVRDGSFIEFDALEYAAAVRLMIASQVREGKIKPDEVRQVVFTGQAESLVILGSDGMPLMNAISWMDERSVEECGEISGLFDEDEIYRRTGQMAALPTWPATKISWLRKNRGDVFENARHYVMLKDYLVYSLTGRLCADRSIATFTFYFDIHEKEYWPEMLQACGIGTWQLPPLVEPCTIAGPLLPFIADELGLTNLTQVNVGALDHFAGMIGSGNVHEGILSLSTGTVMALATIAPEHYTGDCRIALHYGFLPGTLVFLPVAESGGICLEWYRKNFMKNHSLKELDACVAVKEMPGDLIFLPYISGTNAPDFAENTCGMFYGIRARHDEADFAYAVMEGVAHLLARNIDEMRASGIKTEKIIATGGGAKSALWCQIQADVTGVPVEVPADREAACLGAAIIGAVSAGAYDGYDDAILHAVRMSCRFEPRRGTEMQRKRRKFEHLYKSMLETINMR